MPHSPPWTPSGCLRSAAAAVQGSISAGRWQMPLLFSRWQCSRQVPVCSWHLKETGRKNTFRSAPTFNDLSQNSLFCPPQHPSPAWGMWCVPSGWLTVPSSLVKIPCLLKHSFPGSHQRLRRFPLLLKTPNPFTFFFFKMKFPFFFFNDKSKTSLITKSTENTNRQN